MADLTGTEYKAHFFLFYISNYEVYRPQTIWIKEIEMHFLYIFFEGLETTHTHTKTTEHITAHISLVYEGV